MGEGLKKMYDEIQSPYQTDEEDIGECSDSGGDSDQSPVPSPSKKHPGLPASSRFNSKSPLYDFSSLAGKLPPKKGLSKYYQGKSQSFTSLSEVKSLEELSKKEEVSYPKKIKPCRSYVGLDIASRTTTFSSETRDKGVSKKMPPPISSRPSPMARSSSSGFLSCESCPPSFPACKHALNGH